MPGFLFLETSLLLFAACLWGVSQHSMPSKQTIVPRLYCVETSQHLRLLKSFASARQQATGSGGTSLTCTHTLSFAYTASMGNQCIERTVGLHAVLLTVLFLWVTWQTGFEGETNASTVPVAFFPHFLKGNCFFKQLDIYGFSSHCSKLTRWPVKDLNRKASLTLLSSERNRMPHLLLKPQGWLFCDVPAAQRTKCIHTLV